MKENVIRCGVHCALQIAGILCLCLKHDGKRHLREHRRSRRIILTWILKELAAGGEMNSSVGLP
jgi:hypothetical protein